MGGMSSFFKSLGHTLHELFTSKKFLVTVAGVGASILTGGVAPGTAIIAGAVAYVTGQGLSDFGKGAAGKPAGQPAGQP